MRRIGLAWGLVVAGCGPTAGATPSAGCPVPCDTAGDQADDNLPPPASDAPDDGGAAADSEAADPGPPDTGTTDTAPADADTDTDTGQADTDPPDTDPPAPAAGDTRAIGTWGTATFASPATVTMGCVPGRDDVSRGCIAGEFPAHEVTLTRGVWMTTSEVTQGQWVALGLDNPAHFSADGPGEPCGTDCPVERVTWYEALLAANALSALDGLDACYALTGCTADDLGPAVTCTDVAVTAASSRPQDCAGWRLPTEAEWEAAARGGEDLPYPGGRNVSKLAWYDQNNQPYGTKPVCTKDPSTYGLCDLGGNVWEWVWDRFAPYPSTPQTDPTGPASGDVRPVRGGVWYDTSQYPRASARGNVPPDLRSFGIGFRLVRTAEATP